MSSSRWVAGLILVAAVSVSPAVLAADAIVGTWEHEAGGQRHVVTFDADGSGKMDDTKITWSISGQKLAIVANGDTNSYSFKLEGDSLVVSGGDLDAPMTFARKTTAKKTGLGGLKKDGGTGGAKTDPAPDPEKKGATVLGTWKGGDGSTIDITKDTLKLGGNDIPLEITADAFTLTGKQGQKVKWPYKLDGDSLEIVVGGQKQLWKRVGAGTPAATDKPVADKPRPRAKTLVGKWEAVDGTIIQFNADGTFIYGGQSVAYKTTETTIQINGNEWKYKLDGDALVLTLPGEEPTTLKRIGGGEEADEPRTDTAKTDAAKGDEPKIDPGKGGGNVVGAWEGKDGTLFLKADGTGHSAKDGDFKWSIETLEGKQCLKFVQGDKWIGLPYSCQGDKLVFGMGPTVTCSRATVAGVWVAEEASLDPGIYLSFTQYLVLYKDGTIGYAKSEGYASRTQVTDHLERFWSGGEKGAEKKSVGTWKKTGPNTLSIKLSWRDKELKGQYDLDKWLLRVEGMGKLNEGATLDFKRK